MIKNFNLKIKFNPRLILAAAFAVLILLETYWLYTKVYRNLSVDADTIPNGNIVRLDLGAYNQTIGLLDKLKFFTVSSWNLKNTNPFK